MRVAANVSFCAFLTLMALVTVLPAAEGPVPSAPLPPQPRPLQLGERSTAVEKAPSENHLPADGSLIDDIGALRRAVERVRSALDHDAAAVPKIIHQHQGVEILTQAGEADRRFSARFGADRCTGTRIR